MSKSKQFNAAEKHFLDKELKYRKRINGLEKVRFEQIEQLASKDKELDMFKKKNDELEKLLTKSLEYHGLSLEELKRTLKHDEDFVEVHNMLRTFVQAAPFLRV